MTPADELDRAAEHLSQVHAAVDRAVGGLDGPAHGAVLAFRGEVAGLIRRLGRIRMFAERGGSSPRPPAA